jgi:hypothetical protein
MKSVQPNKIAVRYVAAPSMSSQPSKTTTISAAREGSNVSVVCAIGDSSATSAISTLLDSSNG